MQLPSFKLQTSKRARAPKLRGSGASEKLLDATQTLFDPFDRSGVREAQIPGRTECGSRNKRHMCFFEKQGGKLRAIFRQGVWPRAEARRDIRKNIERAARFAALDSGNCVQAVHDAATAACIF